VVEDLVQTLVRRHARSVDVAGQRLQPGRQGWGDDVDLLCLVVFVGERHADARVQFQVADPGALGIELVLGEADLPHVAETEARRGVFHFAEVLVRVSRHSLSSFLGPS